MPKLTQIIRSSGNVIKDSGKEIISPKYWIAVQEWKRLYGEVRKRPEPNSHALSFQLDLVNIATRYYATLLEGLVLAHEIPSNIAQEGYFGAVGDALKFIVRMELFKYAVGKTMEFLSHGSYIKGLREGTPNPN